jgi:exonuclease SbcD
LSEARCELVVTPARRTVDLCFEGRPDLARIEAAALNPALAGAYVRVRWVVGDEDRHEVDRAAIQRLLAGAAAVQLEGRVVPVVRSRCAGISQCAALSDKVRAWARVTCTQVEPLLECLAELDCREPAQIAAEALAGQPCVSDAPWADQRVGRSVATEELASHTASPDTIELCT